MILKETLRSIVRSQRENLDLPEKTVERDDLEKIDMELPFALFISGIRRCGKSTFLRQLMKKTDGFYYMNFEDPRLVNFSAEDFQKLDEIFSEEYGSRKFYFFDEIQNLPKWELLARLLLDRKKHVIITGSNASLLSRELGTKLTGRHLRHELFPFSFAEFLKLSGEKPGLKSFERYFSEGGFPEYLKIKRAEVLQELFNDIIMRDIAVRHNLRSTKAIREMALYLMTNVGKEFSYNSLKNMFGLGSVNSAIAFVSYFEDSYLLFTVPKFDYSLKKQLVSQKKIYSIDNGLSKVNSASFSENRGRMLENLVFLSLRRKHDGIFYFRERFECDFVVKEGARITKAIQACYELDESNRERETGGLSEAMERFGLQEGLILTYRQEDEFKANGKKINVLPVFKWLNHV